MPTFLTDTDSVKHAVQIQAAVSVKHIDEVKKDLYTKKNALGDELQEKIKYLSIAKQPLTLRFSGKLNEPLCLTLAIGGDDGKTHQLYTKSALSEAQQLSIGSAVLEKSFKNFSPADYTVEIIDCTELDTDLSLPLKELTQLKNSAAKLLNNAVDLVANVEVPKLKVRPAASATPSMSILIADVKDIPLCDITEADVYFKLPESWKRDCDKHINIFLNNPRLIPWFPAVLIGKDYEESVRLLERVRPKRIVSNNTGVAYKAFEMGIEWIAGPFLNTTNSYALLTLKEELNCAGAFISNEINQLQIRNIARPDNFKLLYSIYHPILMMTSRQCFFQQTVGCKKPSIEDGCMLKCKKATTITNVKGVSFAVDKQRGGYPSIYNDEQFLNFDIVKDLEGLFDEFFIDLTDIGAGSKAALDKTQLIEHFQNFINGEAYSQPQAQQHLSSMITTSTNAQYSQGL